MTLTKCGISYPKEGVKTTLGFKTILGKSQNYSNAERVEMTTWDQNDSSIFTVHVCLIKSFTLPKDDSSVNLCVCPSSSNSLLGILDIPSALPCRFPAQCSTLKSNSDSRSNHRAT